VVDLAQAATVLGDPSLPAVQRKLWCFAAENARAGPYSANSHEYPVVVHQEAPTPADAAVSAAPTASPASSAVHLSAELQLPRVWSESVQALELDGSEHQGWQRLREQLAERQGVLLHDETPDFQVLHRLFGYPDERRGDMPLACELLAQGHVLGTDPPRAHPHASAVEPHAARWRLLLQLSIDDQLGWAWGGRRERLYVWIDRDDLAAGDFTRVQSFAY